VREMQLTREFQGELQRMKDVLEQKLRSEEQQRLEEQRRIEAKHRSESDELARKYAELTKVLSWSISSKNPPFPFCISFFLFFFFAFLRLPTIQKIA
jgi:hypothetical protein